MVSEIFAARRSALFQKRERFVVAAPLEVVGELRIDGRRELVLKPRDLFGNGAEPLQMSGGVAGVKLSIRDDGEPHSQRGGKSLLRSGRFRHTLEA